MCKNIYGYACIFSIKTLGLGEFLTELLAPTLRTLVPEVLPITLPPDGPQSQDRFPNETVILMKGIGSTTVFKHESGWLLYKVCDCLRQGHMYSRIAL